MKVFSSMRYTELGTSGLKGSVLQLGTWPAAFTNPNDPDAREFVSVIRQSLELGINVFDTAESYGKGRAERVLGQALKEAGVRDQVMIAGKVAMENLHADDVRRSCEASLKRLNTDYLDILYIHIPNPKIPVEETMGALLKLKEEGKIKAIGASNISKEELTAALAAGKIDMIQNCYSMLWRWMEDDLIPYCLDNAIGFVTFSPLVQGILSGKYSIDTDTEQLDDRKRITLFRDKWFGKALVIAEGVKYMAKKYGKTPSQIAINWVLSQNGINSVVISAKNASQLLDNCGALGWQFEQEDLDYLDKLTRTLTDSLPHHISFWWESIWW